MKRLDPRHYICIALTLALALCGFFLFPNALGRLIESFRDFGLSIAFWFCRLFGIKHSITPTVNTLPKIPFFPIPLNPSDGSPLIPLPTTFDGFKAQWAAYWRLWANLDNFLAYLSLLGNVLYYGLWVVVIALPFVLLFRLFLRRYLRKPNNAYNCDSKPLRLYKQLVTKLTPCVTWVRLTIAFIREHKVYRRIWLCLGLFYLNVFTIGIEFLAYGFYFAATFQLDSVYRQVYKLFIDLSSLAVIPVWVWAIVALVWFDRFRKNIAYAQLDHMELRNRGFINARPLVVMVCGTMGKGKTTMLTDICLSTEILFRDKAYEKLLENDLKFPYFPWINLENELRIAMENHTVYNLATCKRFIRTIRYWYEKCIGFDDSTIKVMRRYIRRATGIRVSNTALRCFDYDTRRYGTIYDDNLSLVDLWDVLETYAQLYFIYVIESSLLVSNYSIRSDCILSDLGNFPMWDTDFFHRDSRLLDSYSRHAHILDFDFLRLGKTVVGNNRRRHALEFGVVAVSEIGKERRNALELRERGVKASDADTNQKNDGFNDGLKMRRHAATVDNFAFLKIVSDEQRPESFGADARDMFDVIHIDERSDDSLAMPFFSLGELLYAFLFGRFVDTYRQYRYMRGDNTLFMYLYKTLAAKVYRYYKRIYNRFGYNCLHVAVENGTLDGNSHRNKYFLCWKKIYSNRFSTDCMSAFWEERAMRSPVGLDDLREYNEVKATWDELRAQNSYFISELIHKKNEV